MAHLILAQAVESFHPSTIDLLHAVSASYYSMVLSYVMLQCQKTGLEIKSGDKLIVVTFRVVTFINQSIDSLSIDPLIDLSSALHL